MNSAFTQAREAFQAFALALRTNAELFGDVESAFRLLLTRYNTQIYENRFLVGGVAERIIAATFVAMGKTAKNHGVEVTRTDICVGGVNLSVKGSFRPRPSSIRMVNVMGASEAAAWKEPTVFVISARGIGYADPELLPGATTRARDVVQLPTRHLFTLWDTNPSLFIRMGLPFSRDDVAGSDIASRVVADEIFRYTTILKPFDKREPSE